ncbi:MAG: hypothetical protein ACYC96_11590 [Fimbriimonadaceae bacterium]
MPAFEYRQAEELRHAFLVHNVRQKDRESLGRLKEFRDYLKQRP